MRSHRAGKVPWQDPGPLCCSLTSALSRAPSPRGGGGGVGRRVGAEEALMQGWGMESSHPRGQVRGTWLPTWMQTACVQGQGWEVWVSVSRMRVGLLDHPAFYLSFQDNH